MVGESEFDVVVVGSGAAGLATAATAARLGLRVLVLEKSDTLGGTTRLSVGSFSASCTPQQRKLGIFDSPEAHFEDLGTLAMASEREDNLALRRILVTHIPETFTWLMGLGVKFAGPYDEPPHKVPRMHMVLPSSQAYIRRLSKEILRCGGQIKRRMEVVELMLRDGVVCGAKLVDRTTTRELSVRARCGVVLATGDYSASPALKQTYANTVVAETEAISPTSTGDGHVLAMSVGSEILNGDLIAGPQLRFPPPKGGFWAEWVPDWRPITATASALLRYAPAWVNRILMSSFLTSHMAPELSILGNGGVLIDDRGSSATPPAFGGSTSGFAKASSTRSAAHYWLVLDKSAADLYRRWPHFISTAPGIAYAYLQDYIRMRPDIVHRADDIAALSYKIRVDQEAFMAAYEGQRGAPPTSALYALGPLIPRIVLTDGGVRVNERLQVLNRDGECISGLYAVGSVGQGGLLLNGHGHHIAWALTSGRLAARSVAADSLEGR